MHQKMQHKSTDTKAAHNIFVKLTQCLPVHFVLIDALFTKVALVVQKLQ